MQQEDDTKGEGGQSGNNDGHSYDDEDEMIDMEMDDCSSDDEHGPQWITPNRRERERDAKTRGNHPWNCVAVARAVKAYQIVTARCTRPI